ncbi:MAG: hypothetical protein V1676_06450 [Candidatus Diapherotrites archaeon]
MNQATEKENTELVNLAFRATVALIIAGSLVALLVMLAYNEPEHGTAVYLVHDSWDSYLRGGKAVFTYGIENREGRDMNYAVRFFAAGTLIKSGDIFVPAGKSIEVPAALDVPAELRTYPFKIRVVASYSGSGQEAFFWIKGSGASAE